MRRRDFFALARGVTAGLLGCRLPAFARTRLPPKVGRLKIQGRTDPPGWLQEFRAGLRAAGHAEGKTFVLEERCADGDASRRAGLAEELLRSEFSIIVARSQQALDAASP